MTDREAIIEIMVWPLPPKLPPGTKPPSFFELVIFIVGMLGLAGILAGVSYLILEQVFNFLRWVFA